MTGTDPGPAPIAASDGPVVLVAPAKLTLSLRVVGVRPDGYHLLESEMVSLDLADTLLVRSGDRLTVRPGDPDGEDPTDAPAIGAESPGTRGRDGVPGGAGNLVSGALRALDRRADIELIKRVPPGAGLGGGSADAAAVLRWAECRDPEVALNLGADVPFCVTGGRALVRGIGEQIEPLPYEDRAFTLLLLPFGMDTAAVYRAWDRMASDRPTPPGTVTGQIPGGNDLEAAALQVDHRLAGWKAVFADATNREPRLAGSGSTWFVEGSPEELGIDSRFVALGAERARVVGTRTVPAVG